MKKRSITINGHRTSIALEAPFWNALDAIARENGASLPQLVADIDKQRMATTPAPGLASALRVFVLGRADKRRG